MTPEYVRKDVRSLVEYVLDGRELENFIVYLADNGGRVLTDEEVDTVVRGGPGADELVERECAAQDHVYAVAYRLWEWLEGR